MSIKWDRRRRLQRISAQRRKRNKLTGFPRLIADKFTAMENSLREGLERVLFDEGKYREKNERDNADSGRKRTRPEGYFYDGLFYDRIAMKWVERK